MECPSCFELLSPGSVGSHLLRRHSGRVISQWVCGLCAFAANAFADALAHGLLHGHPVDKLRDLTSSADKSSKERAWTAVKQLQFTTSVIQSGNQAFEAGPKVPIALNEKTRGEEWTEMYQRICEGRKENADGENAEEDYDCDHVTSRNIGPTADEVPMSVGQDAEMLSPVAAENTQEMGHQQLKKVQSLMNSCCNQCGKGIVLFRKNRTRPCVNMALVHVGTCLSILPYACSQCGHRGASRSTINYHLNTSSCFSASVIISEPAKYEKCMREGLAICFPQHSFTWNGFSATEHVSEPTEPTTEVTEPTEPTSCDGMSNEPDMDSRCETKMNSRIKTTYKDAFNELTNEKNREQTGSSCEIDTIEQEMSILYNEPELDSNLTKNLRGKRSQRLLILNQL